MTPVSLGGQFEVAASGRLEEVLLQRWSKRVQAAKNAAKCN